MEEKKKKERKRNVVEMVYDRYKFILLYTISENVCNTRLLEELQM